MDENFKISDEDIRMASLQLTKETLAHCKLLTELLVPIYCHIKNQDINIVAKNLELLYKEKMNELDNYIKAEFGHLDISSILKPKSDSEF